MKDTEQLTLKPAEAAKMLNISMPVMYDLCKRADFPAIRFGRAIVIPKAGLEKWLADQSA